VKPASAAAPTAGGFFMTTKPVRSKCLTRRSATRRIVHRHGSLDPLFNAPAPARVTSAIVTFALGRALIVTAGRGCPM